MFGRLFVCNIYNVRIVSEKQDATICHGGPQICTTREIKKALKVLF